MTTTDLSLDLPSPDKTANPWSGDAYTDHMYSALWSQDTGWHESELLPLQNLSLHPGTVGLHDGQSIFEGIKAHRQVGGGVAVFRPRENALRFQRSARRLAMPELPEDVFIEAIDQLVRADQGRLTDGDWTIGDGKPSPVTMALHQAIVDVQHGAVPDPDGWLHHIPTV
jgi:branched-subunit amino acid aminotransferase/4-amino-4-deoxychorismate lyase